MDALSVVGLLDATAGTLQIIRELTQDIRYAPTEIASLARSLQALMDILDGVVHDKMRVVADNDQRGSNLHRALQDCDKTIADLSEFLQDSRSSSSSKRRLRWTLSKGRINTLLNQLDRGKATIQLGLTASAGSRNDQFMDFVTARTLEEQKERERTRIIDWLSIYDFEARHLDLQSLRLTGTFDWFRECDLYREWRTGTLRLLWLEGRIGVGKSTLCSFVVDDLQSSLGAYHMLAYIYLNHRDHQARTKSDVLRIILRQLCLQTDGVHDSVRQLWDVFGLRGLAPTYEALRRSLHDVLESSAEHHAFICLDGLDEVNRESQPSIIELLRDFNLEASISTLVTSRSSRPADNLSSRTYAFAAHLSDTDKYINQQLGKSRRLESKLSLRNKLFEKLSPSAEGMFLAVALRTDEALKQRSPKMMLKALESLPSKLCSIYMDIIEKFSAGNSHQIDIAMTLFALMLRTARSPTFEEVQVSLAVVQGEDGPDLEEALINVEDILDCCMDLVIGNFETRTLSFSHPTVREFLLGLDAVKQQVIPVSTLNDRFPGLFDPAPFTRIENGHYHAIAGIDDGESTYGSEVFSQFSRDETLVPLIGRGEPRKGVSPLRGTSVSEQLVQLFMADPALPGLVTSALQRVGATGFERTFSILLKQYSKNLEIAASKPSQKVAAVWIGHATRRTASLLRAAVRPENIEDDKLREATLEFDTSKDLAVNKWLAAQDGGLNPGRKADIASPSEVAGPLSPVQLINDEEDGLLNKSDDEDLSTTYTDLDAVKIFMTGSEPYMELKSSLIKQTHHEDQAKDPFNRRIVLESEKAMIQKANIDALIVFTLLTIVFLPLSFFVPIYGMNGIGPLDKSVYLPIMITLLYITTFLLIVFLNDKSGFGRWSGMSMQNFWNERLASLSIVVEHRPKWGPEANMTLALRPFAGMNARDQLLMLWLGILNWKGNLSNSLHVWKNGRKIDMTYFQWTCQCGRTFHEAVRELVPGAAEKWVTSISSGQSETDQASLSSSSSSNEAPYTEASGAEGRPQYPKNETHSETEIKITEADPALAEYIMLCIKQKQRRVRLFPDNIKDKRTDRETFISIKKVYESERASSWRLNTLSHVEFKKFQLYHSDYVDVSRNEKEEVPECAQKCESGCGNGCVEYWYSPPRVEQAPPIPRNAMVHFLESPSCLGTQRANRAALPKRREILELRDVHAKEGWGLIFKEKVWSLPIVAVQILGVFAAIVVTILWCVKDEIKVGSFLPGLLVLGTGQSIAGLLQRWAEYNLDEHGKAQ